MGAVTDRLLRGIVLLPLIGSPATPVAQTDGQTLNFAKVIGLGLQLACGACLQHGSLGANPAGQTISGPPISDRMGGGYDDRAVGAASPNEMVQHVLDVSFDDAIRFPADASNLIDPAPVATVEGLRKIVGRAGLGQWHPADVSGQTSGCAQCRRCRAGARQRVVI